MDILSSSDSKKTLIELCYMAKGDISKGINIENILIESKKYHIENIIDELTKYNLIRKIDDKVITITRQGFYYVTEVLDKRPNNLHMLRYDQAEDLAIRMIQQSLFLSKNVINVEEIIKWANNRLIVAQQIIEIMKDKGLVRILENVNHYK